MVVTLVTTSVVRLVYHPLHLVVIHHNTVYSQYPYNVDISIFIIGKIKK